MNNSSSMQMKAVTIPEFGEAEVLRVAAMTIPEPESNQVGIDGRRHPANELWFTDKTVSGFNLAACSAASPGASQALCRAVAAAAKEVLLVRAETLPLEQAAEARRSIESGTTTGKLVLEVAAL